MLEILYKIYIKDSDVKEWWDKEIETMDAFICENREEFKNHIRDIYGANIKFRNDKTVKYGEYYCIIVGSYKIENNQFLDNRYFTIKEYTCSYCGKHVRTINGYDRTKKIPELPNKIFCDWHCEDHYLTNLKKEVLGEEEYILTQKADKYAMDQFTRGISGYIYMITNKETNQFYVGQTRYNPVFRWAQHLKTERFPIENILNYKFEILEIVPDGESILAREAYYIKLKYKEAPELSLNKTEIPKD